MPKAPTDDLSLESREPEELWKDISEFLGATSNAARSKVIEEVVKIGNRYESNIHQETMIAPKAPGRKKSRKSLERQALLYDKAAEAIDETELFKNLYGTATDNPYQDRGVRETEEHTERRRRRHVLKKLLKEEAADCRERANKPGWQTTGRPTDNLSMSHGTPVSNLFTDCAKLFEEYRPGRISHAPGGKFEALAGCVFELSAGRSMEQAGHSIESCVRKAVDLHKKNLPKK